MPKSSSCHKIPMVELTEKQTNREKTWSSKDALFLLLKTNIFDKKT